MGKFIVAARLRYSIKERQQILTVLWDKAEAMNLIPYGNRGSSYGFWIDKVTDEFRELTFGSGGYIY